MTPFVWPENPTFAHPSEKKVFEILRDSLSDNDAIFTNLKITDAQYGDVEIDLVLLIKDRGCMVVEIKGGHIAFDGQEWIQSDRNETRKIYPHDQAIKAMYSLRTYLRNKWSQGNLKTEWVVAFPDSAIPNVQSPSLPTARIIDKNELIHGISKIRGILGNQERLQLPAISTWVNLASSHLRPLSIMEANFEDVLENNYEFIRDLTHQRKWILDLIADNPRIYVQGPAGSGKTWLAFEQAVRWTRMGLRVGIVTFNRGLVTYLNMKTEELPQEDRPAWVGTFHGFAEFMGTTAGAPSKYGEVPDPYAAKLLEAAQRLDQNQKFDAWIVDEAQDFLDSWWKVLKITLKDPEHGRMALFGDDQQLVYLNRAKPEGFFAYVRLVENIRNSQQIAQAVKPFLHQEVSARGPNAFPVEFIESTVEEAFSNADDVVERLTDKENWHPGEIALLTTMHQHPEQKSLIHDRFSYWESLWAKEDVFYCTVGGFKGLERPVVVLAVDGFHDEESMLDFLYVGMTRARDKLVVVAPIEIIEKIKGTVI